MLILSAFLDDRKHAEIIYCSLDPELPPPPPHFPPAPVVNHFDIMCLVQQNIYECGVFYQAGEVKT